MKELALPVADEREREREILINSKPINCNVIAKQKNWDCLCICPRSN